MGWSENWLKMQVPGVPNMLGLGLLPALEGVLTPWFCALGNPEMGILR